MVPEFRSRICWGMSSLIRSGISTALEVFQLLSGPAAASRALTVTRAEAPGPASAWACLFQGVSSLRSLVALAMSSPTFSGDGPRGRPRGPGPAWHGFLHGRAHLSYRTPVSVGPNFGGLVEAAGVGCTWIWGDRRKLHPGLE